MKNVYPIIITKDENFFTVYIPDFDINTQGRSVADAIDMSREAIGLCALCIQDDGKDIPEVKTYKPECNDGELIALVDIDFAEFRIKEENKAVRKNCTIPQWMNREAEAQNINFSAVLQEALKKQLNL